MQKIWKQILVALLLCVIVPRLLVTIGGGATSTPKPSQDNSQPTQNSTQAQTETGRQISVVLEDGNIQRMELEEYVMGVILAEMPAEFEIEALKAQAVVARTYTMRRAVLGDRHNGGGVCVDPGCCQAYITKENYISSLGVAADISKIAEVVQQTAGQVLTYNGELAETTYFSCSGGRTEDALAVWGEPIPYLQAVDSPGEEFAQHHRQTIRLSPNAFCKALDRNLEGNPGKWLGEVQYTAGGGVDYQFLGGVCYDGVELRHRFKLNSTAFTICYNGNDFEIQTKGKGHRVGMSQYGAEAMAVAGSDYMQILSHYYPGTRIDKNAVLG